MSSGVCLEGDSLDHAAAASEFGQPVNVSYDMREGDGPVWNLGIGCKGLTIHGPTWISGSVFRQPLRPPLPQSHAPC